ncbi:sensor histidine kinase [Flavilitoribacter nigricans]|uniref:Histidine kinase domain-containing protein n=1 Tax=Flavilitoribacter nigricans (strain ATCC 23147 / DSM 23189 / NBRC 102662 / NCIMB 1420 / SS-2) TaxID=1122177 RepID=A0A2D0NA02_FLAN2|nr:histidine kinase [Flavilitoribacter nigricans]PHN05315.1 hypothetical protein CRP01_17520 [Flavilitoribacter nigricans DSM 23189 = NBRC 102662]
MQGQVKKTGGSDLKLILVLTAVFTLSQVTTFFRIYAQHQMDGVPLDWGGAIWDRFLAWIIGFIFLVAIVITTRRYLLEKKSWPLTIGIHLFIAAVVSFIWYVTLISISKLFGPTNGEAFANFDLLYWFFMNFDKLFLLYLCTAIITYAYYYVQRDRDNRINRSKMENQLLEARLKMLQSQLHPHFLFNTLNSITSLMDVDIHKAKIMTVDLADLLRHVLAHKDVQLINLDDELAILSKYVDIEKTRFSDDLEINWHLEGDFKRVQIPSMLLQPLVENSIKHGFSRQHPSLRIDIRLKRLKDRLQVIIEDNGQGIPQQEAGTIFETGTGIQNTQQRLESIYGDQQVFSVTNKPEGGVMNLIEIPLALSVQSPLTEVSRSREVLTS